MIDFSVIKKFILALLLLNFFLPNKVCLSEAISLIPSKLITEQNHKCCKGEKAKKESPETFKKVAPDCCTGNCACTSQFLTKLETPKVNPIRIYYIDFSGQIYTKIFSRDIFYPPKMSA